MYIKFKINFVVFILTICGVLTVKTIHCSELVASSEPRWITKLKDAIDRNTEEKIIYLGGETNSITAITDSNNNPIAKHYASKNAELLLHLAEETGIIEHLAPITKINNIYYEKFITLFSDQKTKDIQQQNRDAHTLNKIKGNNKELNCLRLYKTLGTIEIQNILKSIDNNSIDLLFLHHIIFSAPDSNHRNFMLQYQGEKLKLIRIDYCDDILYNSMYFFGEYTSGFNDPFGSKGHQIIQNLLSFTPNPEPWDNFIIKNEINIKNSSIYIYNNTEELINSKSKYFNRLKTLSIMYEEGFFENRSRGETMVALLYISWYCQIILKTVNNFSDDYMFSKLVNDNSFISRELLITVSLLKSIRDIYNYQNIRQFHEFFNTSNKMHIIENPDIIRTAVQEWISTPNKHELIAIREFLPFIEIKNWPFSFLFNNDILSRIFHNAPYPEKENCNPFNVFNEHIENYNLNLK